MRETKGRVEGQDTQYNIYPQHLLTPFWPPIMYLSTFNLLPIYQPHFDTTTSPPPKSISTSVDSSIDPWELILTTLDSPVLSKNGDV